MNNCNKKKILIVNNNLAMGGIQKSLVNLVKDACGEYDITLLLFSKSGALLNEIPDDVKILTPGRAYSIMGLEKEALKKHPDLFALKVLMIAYTKFFSRRNAMKLLGIFQKKIQGYDAVISYSHFPHPKYFGNGCADFVLDKTSAAMKVCCIHCDYLNFGGRSGLLNKAYLEFDKIACCSDSVRERFLLGSDLPDDRVYTLRNFYDLDLMSYRMAPAEVFDAGSINLLTIARLSAEKGIIRAVEALAHGGRKDIHYYIIGDGPQRMKIEETICRYHMEASVTLLGEKRDPYPYLRQADWLLVPSYHEAAPMVFDEAILMGTKVITTNTTSAEEMIGNTHGIVCENSTEGIAAALMKIGKAAKIDVRKFDNKTQRIQLSELIET